MSQKLDTSPAVIGIDIGKNSFHIVGQNQRGAIVLRQKWSRGQWRMSLRAQRSCAGTVLFVRSGSVKASHHRRNGKPATCAISILPNRIRSTDAWTGLWKPDETAVAPQIRAAPLHILLT
jgi:hypothetical protein